MPERNSKTTKHFIAYVEQIEELNNGTKNIILDALTMDMYDRLDPENLSNINTEIPTYFFNIALSNEQLRISEINFEINSWVQFSASEEQSEFRAQVYNDIAFEDNFTLLYIKDIKPFYLENKQKKIFSMEIFDEAEKNDLFDLINDIEANMVIAYNVGQGNCNGICDETGMPLIYFDFGGGVFQNTKTYPGNYENPIAINFCFTTSPLVILSHWDWDHMASATKIEHAAIKEYFWIVPKQEIGITHLKFAMELNRKGNLFIWPNHLLTLRTRNIHVQKLHTDDPKDKNNNGLSIIVRTRSIYNEYFVLLPGDANYSLLDLKEYKYLHGLVATHHGASSHNCLDTIPKASLLHTIAYSCGKNNTYNHPKRVSILEHKKLGWRNKKSTQNGHIALGTDHIFKTMPCRGHHCSLLPKQ